MAIGCLAGLGLARLTTLFRFAFKLITLPIQEVNPH